MATEKLKIEEHHVRQAQYVAEKDGFPKGEIRIYSDEKFTGLRLQMEGKTASWVVRFRNSSITIGYIYPTDHPRLLTALKKVRDLAGAVRGMLEEDEKDKERIKNFLATYYAPGQANRDIRKSAAASEGAAERKTAITTWTLRECVEATIKGKTAPDSKDRIKPNTVKDYNGTFNRPAFRKAMETPAAKLTRGDIEAVRDEVKRDVGASPAIKVITYFRAVMTYCSGNHSGLSGLEGAQPWWTMLNAPFKVKPRDRRPEIEAIVSTLILAEEYLDKPLPGRAQGVAGVKHGTLAGLWWLVLTCQRAGAGLSLLAHDVVDDKEEGWKLAAWAEDVMKAGQAHVLPVPAEAWTAVDSFRQKGKNSSTQEWTFPSEAKKGTVPVTASGVYRILYRLAGRDALILEEDKKDHPKKCKKDHPKKRKKAIPLRTPRRDLLKEAGIDWWSMHDLRRAITKTLDEHGIPGGATVILAHDIHEREALAVGASEREREDFLRNRTARITKMAYGGAQYLGLKREALKIWTDAILTEYARQKGQGEEQQAA